MGVRPTQKYHHGQVVAAHGKEYEIMTRDRRRTPRKRRTLGGAASPLICVDVDSREVYTLAQQTGRLPAEDANARGVPDPCISLSHPFSAPQGYLDMFDSAVWQRSDLASSGPTLVTRVMRSRRLAEPVVRRYFRHALCAVAAVHARGSAHGSMHAGCCVVDDQDVLRVWGFGEDAFDVDVYAMPPEVGGGERGGAETLCSPLGDMWSLGHILYFMLVGRCPFTERVPASKVSKELARESIARHCAGEYTLPHHVPRPAGDLIARLLVVDPRARAGLQDVIAHEWVQGADGFDVDATRRALEAAAIADAAIHCPSTAPGACTTFKRASPPAALAAPGDEPPSMWTRDCFLQ